MAGDWIKMRVWLRRDPRVVWMSDVLATDRRFMDWLTNPSKRTCDKSAHEHVTRDVTASLCVTALLETWGIAREQGRRVGDDLVVDKCDVNIIEAICCLPGFGVAMSEVGWFVGNEDGSGTFPKFFADKDSPEKRHSSAAARQARYRAKKRKNSDVTGDVTGDVEKRREEKRRGSCTNVQETPLPPELQTTEFLSAWSDWLQHRAEIRKPLKPTATANKLRELAKWGPARAVAAIRHSIGNGWQGIFEPNGFADAAGDGVVKRALDSLDDEMHAEEAKRAEGRR